MKEKILEILENEKLARQLGLKGREMARNEFNYSNTARKIVDIFSKLI